MLTKLSNLIRSNLFENSLREYDSWDSLIINRRKPETYRIFRQFGENRVCLHRFSPCNSQESFWHPHPWPAAFKIMYGKYRLDLGFTPNGEDKPTVVSSCVMSAGSSYEMLDENTWHKITPLDDSPVYTIMLNGPPYPDPHIKTVTTKGKDLDKMSEGAKLEMMWDFMYLVGDSRYE